MHVEVHVLYTSDSSPCTIFPLVRYLLLFLKKALSVPRFYDLLYCVETQSSAICATPAESLLETNLMQCVSVDDKDFAGLEGLNPSYSTTGRLKQKDKNICTYTYLK